MVTRSERDLLIIEAGNGGIRDARLGIEAKFKGDQFVAFHDDREEGNDAGKEGAPAQAAQQTTIRAPLPDGVAPVRQDGRFETERWLDHLRVRRAPGKSENAIKQLFRVHEMTLGVRAPVLVSIFFIFARARKARTLIAARLQPVSPLISCTERSSR